MPLLYPVILSGGVGSRLWPLSRSLAPKQVLALAGERSLLQDTALRVAGEGFSPPLIICNADHRFLVAEQMRGVGVEPRAIILEPEGRNTAPAAALAALTLAQTDPDAILLLTPADHIVRDESAFARAMTAAAHAASDGKLVTFGVTPHAPETGYGYIQRGPAIDAAEQVFRVARFVEKPDAATAARYIASADYYWNSGLFLFQARAYLQELERLAPAMLAACHAAMAGARTDLDFIRLDDAAFRRCPANSIDYTVMEHTDRAALVPVEMGWSDIGSWQALWNVGEKDADDNVVRGDILLKDVKDSYLRSEGPLLAAVGVHDLVVVATKDAVLVSRKGASQDVKDIVAQLERSGRELHQTHQKVHRPWGDYESLDNSQNFQVKRITVKPGAKLSLQMHHKRAEHWVVVSGVARVTCGDRTFDLNKNESTFIPQGVKHRLENPGDVPLQLIEVQSGSYFGEDDIVRFEDSYGRGP